MARTEEEVAAVVAVLSEFFHETPSGWYHDRCEEELESYRKSTSQKSIAGKASAAARATKRQQAINGISTAVEQASNGTPTNQEPVTTNQEPVTKEKKAPPIGDDILFPGVDPQVVADFKALRKQKKAAITKTAIDKIVSEAAKAGWTLEDALRMCCSRGWQGFEAEWVAKRANTSSGSASGEKFNFSQVDHSSSRAAMEASMKKHGIVTPDEGDIPF